MNRHGGYSDDSDDIDLDDIFKGTQVKAMSLEQEVKVWEKVRELCEDQLAKYPTSLKADLELLEKDEASQKLTSNERNCVLFRVGEKRILDFLLTSANRMIELSKMTQKEAKRVVN
jgi:hypothetical protein